MSKVLTCVEWDPTTETCTASAWLDAPSLLPNLPVEGALQILSATALVLVVAHGWNRLDKFISEKWSV
jgi:hypothetical protein